MCARKTNLKRISLRISIRPCPAHKLYMQDYSETLIYSDDTVIMLSKQARNRQLRSPEYGNTQAAYTRLA